MKVLLGTPFPYKDQKIEGGVEAVTKNLIDGFNLYENSLNIRVVSGSNYAKKTFESYNGTTYIKKPNIKIGSIFISQYPFRIKKFLNENNFDIINAHELEFAYYSLKNNDKLLYTLHGFNWEEKKYLKKYKQPLWDIYYVKETDSSQTRYRILGGNARSCTNVKVADADTLYAETDSVQISPPVMVPVEGERFLFRIDNGELIAASTITIIGSGTQSGFLVNPKIKQDLEALAQAVFSRTEDFFEAHGNGEWLKDK